MLQLRHHHWSVRAEKHATHHARASRLAAQRAHSPTFFVSLFFSSAARLTPSLQLPHVLADPCKTGWLAMVAIVVVGGVVVVVV